MVSPVPIVQPEASVYAPELNLALRPEVFKPDLATFAIDSPVSTEKAPAVKGLFRPEEMAHEFYQPGTISSVRKLTPGPNKFANAGQRTEAN